MANGKFSSPRPNRDEEREIERAFRQVTGQAPPSTPPVPDVPPALDVDELDLSAFDLVFNEEPPAAGLPPVQPAAQKPISFGEKLLLFLSQAQDAFEHNRKVVLVALCAAALILILAFMGIFFASASDPYDKTILNNVILGDVNVGGMTKEEAISALKQATARTYPVLDMVVDLEGSELRLSPADTGVSLDVKAAVNAAYDYGRTGTKAEKEQAYQDSLAGDHIIGLLPYLEWNDEFILGTLKNYAQDSGSTLTQTSYGLEGGLPDLKDPDFDPETAPVQTLVILMGTPGIGFDANAVYEQILDAYSLHAFTVTVEGLDTVSEPDPLDLEAVYEEFFIAPVNATVDHQNHKVIPGTYGYHFDMDMAEQLLSQAQYGEKVRIPMKYIAPTVLNEDMFFQDVLAEYETAYKDRGSLQTNLMLACEAINGTVLNPGETFSFNNTVGQRTSAKGYKHADDQITKDKNRILGGGISQVSSALYYCTLVADLNVTDRTSHAVVPGYSDYGLDAAVGWTSPDFKFTNTLGLPIQIQASADNGKVRVSILGTDERDYVVALDYEISGTKAFKTEYRDFDFDNEEGYQDGDIVQEGVMGYIIKTYQLKYDDHSGELISKDYVTTTQYGSVPKIIARVKPEETTEATEETEAPTEETEETTEATTEETTEETTVETTAAPPETSTTVPDNTTSDDSGSDDTGTSGSSESSEDSASENPDPDSDESI